MWNWQISLATYRRRKKSQIDISYITSAWYYERNNIIKRGKIDRMEKSFFFVCLLRIFIFLAPHRLIEKWSNEGIGVTKTYARITWRKECANDNGGVIWCECMENCKIIVRTSHNYTITCFEPRQLHEGNYMSHTYRLWHSSPQKPFTIIICCPQNVLISVPKKNKQKWIALIVCFFKWKIMRAEAILCAQNSPSGVCIQKFLSLCQERRKKWMEKPFWYWKGT